jgi:crossover junction endodeoxyribonuclease RuvC
VRILGVDPGLKITGYAIIEHNEQNEFLIICTGELMTKKNEKKRHMTIFNGLKDILNVYKPDICGVEKIFVNNNPITSLQLSQARGIAILAFEFFDKQYFEMSPTTIKKEILGHGFCKKIHIQNYMSSLFGLDLTPDASDALAIAITTLKTYNQFIEDNKIKEENENNFHRDKDLLEPTFVENKKIRIKKSKKINEQGYEVSNL